MKVKKTIFISIFVSLALVVSLLESYIPIPVPNVRLGLSNVILINALLFFGFFDTFFISLLKSLLLVLILGNPISFIYNFSAGLVSIIVMYFVNKYLKRFFSLVGISVLGSIFYIITQISISAIILRTFSLYNFVAILEIVGIFTGIIVGIVANYLYKILRSSYGKE